MSLPGRIKENLIWGGVFIWALFFIAVVEICRLNPRWREEIDMAFGDYYE